MNTGLSPSQRQSDHLEFKQDDNGEYLLWGDHGTVAVSEDVLFCEHKAGRGGGLAAYKYVACRCRNLQLPSE